MDDLCDNFRIFIFSYSNMKRLKDENANPVNEGQIKSCFHETHFSIRYLQVDLYFAIDILLLSKIC